MAVALQTYGMILADGGNIPLTMDRSAAAYLGSHDLALLQVSDFEMVARPERTHHAHLRLHADAPDPVAPQPQEVYAASPCWVASSPSRSSSSWTRRPIVRSSTKRMPSVTTSVYPPATRSPTACFQRSDGSPARSPSAPAGFSAFRENTPTSSAPSMPPTPCTPQASSESS